MRAKEVKIARTDVKTHARGSCRFVSFFLPMFTHSIQSSQILPFTTAMFLKAGRPPVPPPPRPSPDAPPLPHPPPPTAHAKATTTTQTTPTPLLLPAPLHWHWHGSPTASGPRH